MSLALPEAEPALPKFVPSTELVTATAAAMVGDDVWGELGPVHRHKVRTTALEVLSAVGDDLVGAALDHVTTHAAAFGFNEHLAQQIMFARMAGPIAAVDAEGGDVELEDLNGLLPPDPDLSNPIEDDVPDSGS